MESLLWNTGATAAFDTPVPQIYTAGTKALRLSLRSQRATWLEFMVELTDDLFENGYRSKILVEWTGVEDIDLRVSSLEPFGGQADLRRCTRLRFIPMTCAFAPTQLELLSFEWLDEIPLYRVNDRDWMLENFMSPRYWDAGEWARLPGDGLRESDVEFAKNWIWCVISYAIGPERAHRLAYEKEYDVDISGFESLLVSVTTDNRGIFRVWLTIDGHRRLALEQRGLSDRQDLRIPVAGDRLQGVALELIEAGPHRPEDEGQKVGANVAWLILQKRGFDPRENREVRGCDPIAPNQEGEPFEKSLPLSFLICHEDIRALKKHASTSAFHRKTISGIVAEAESHLAYGDPEKLVGRFSFVPYTRYGLNLLQDPTLPVHQVLVYSALAYALTGDMKYAVTARRFLLSICRCDNWSTGFMTRFPVGLEGYRHPLADGPMARSVAVCYDLIFNTLTVSDRREVEDAMMRCAIPVMDSFLQRMDQDASFKRSNMFMCYSLCLLYAIAVASRSHPEARDFHGRAISRIQDVLGLIYETDGSYHEGMGYWQFTTSLAVESALLLSKELGTPVPALLTEGFRRTIDFILQMHTVCGTGPRFYGIADGAASYTMAGVSLLFFARYLGRADALWLFDELFLEGILESGDELKDDPEVPGTRHFFGAANWMIMNAGLLMLGFYQPGATREPPRLAEFERFAVCERVFMRTGVRAGDTALFFEGGRQTFFHAHLDKGQVLLDAKGVQFLTDPGMISYNDPGSLYYDRTAYHNVPTIGNAEQSYPDRSRAVVRMHEESSPAHSFYLADLSPSYPGAGCVRRAILFVRPDYFLLMDEIQAARDVIRWNFHSVLPFETFPHGAVIRSDQASLTMLWPDGIIAEARTGAYYDARGAITCHNLALRAAGDIDGVLLPVLMLPSSSGDEVVVRCATVDTGPRRYEMTARGGFGEDVVRVCADGDGGRSIEVRRDRREDVRVRWRV